MVMMMVMVMCNMVVVEEVGASGIKLMPIKPWHLESRLANIIDHHHAVAFAGQAHHLAMAKDYKAMKEAWVTGLTGGSVADVNSVSLAMPVHIRTFSTRLCSPANNCHI
jgi:hypothetical protein